MKKLLCAVSLLLAVILGWNLGPPLVDWCQRNWLYPRPYREEVQAEAAEFGLDENLVYAVMKAESGFDERAQSHAGAQGLMQLTPQTFQWIASLYPPEHGGDNILDPRDNIHCGCALLRLLLDRYAGQEEALCAYNAGIGTVDGWLSGDAYSDDGAFLHTVPYPETAAYVKKTTQYRERYEALYKEKP